MNKIKLSKYVIRKFKENEDNNLHSENLVLLAKASKNKELILEARAILEIHLTRWYMSNALYTHREYIFNEIIKYISWS